MEENFTWTVPMVLSRTDTINGIVKPPVVSLGVASRKTKRRSGVVTVDYIQYTRWAAKRKPVNPFWFQIEETTMPQGWWVATWIPNGNKSVYYGPDPGQFGTRTYLTPSVSMFSDMRAEADARLLAKIKNTKVNLANVIAEGAQTAQLILGLAKAVAGAIQGLRSGNFVAAAKSLGVPVGSTRMVKARKRYNRTYPRDPTTAAANAWLALHFGVVPLVNDVLDAARALADWNYEAKAPITKVTTVVKRILDAKENPQNGYVTMYKTESKVKLSCNIRVDLETFNKLKTIGLTNSLSPAWELLPGSFLVDWILPIGRWIDNLDALVGVSIVDACQIVVNDKKISMDLATSFISGNYHWTYNIHGKTRWFDLHRTPDDGPSVLTLPRFKNPFSTTHVATAAGLARQFFKSAFK